LNESYVKGGLLKSPGYKPVNYTNKTGMLKKTADGIAIIILILERAHVENESHEEKAEIINPKALIVQKKRKLTCVYAEAVEIVFCRLISPVKLMLLEASEALLFC
jgi:hypothetical protein